MNRDHLIGGAIGVVIGFGVAFGYKTLVHPRRQNLLSASSPIHIHGGSANRNPTPFAFEMKNGVKFSCVTPGTCGAAPVDVSQIAIADAPPSMQADLIWHMDLSTKDGHDCRVIAFGVGAVSVIFPNPGDGLKRDSSTGYWIFTRTDGGPVQISTVSVNDKLQTAYKAGQDVYIGAWK